MEQVILVDSEDNEIGTEEKEAAHQNRLPLHRAFSVFLFNDNREMLITKRSDRKNTWPLHWSNACCSHPRPGETAEDAAKRRVQEELGIRIDEVKFLFKFEYEAEYDEKWGEHELDHVFVGKHDGPLNVNKEEVADWKFVPKDELIKDVASNPDKYTPWFKKCFRQVLEERQQSI